MARDIAHSVSHSASLPAPLRRARIGHAPLRRPSPLARLLTLLGLVRQRRQLGKLDEHLLRDIGVTRLEADREARRAFWDAPRHWRQ